MINVRLANRDLGPSPLDEVFDFMKRHRLRTADLTECCGSQLDSPNRKIADRARAVSRCWDLMARHGIKYSRIEFSDAKNPEIF